MKVELDAKGTLVIRAESSVESFALAHWLDLWNRKEAILLLQTPIELKPVISPDPTSGQQEKP